MASSSLRSVNPNAEIMGKQAALFMNINAAKGLQDVMKSNLGPKGTIKMLVGGAGGERHALFARSHPRHPPAANARLPSRSSRDPIYTRAQLSNPARTPRSDAPTPPPADALTLPSPAPPRVPSPFSPQTSSSPRLVPRLAPDTTSASRPSRDRARNEPRPPATFRFDPRESTERRSSFFQTGAPTHPNAR